MYTSKYDPFIGVALDYIPRGGPDGIPAFHAAPMRQRSDGAAYTSRAEGRLCMHAPDVPEFLRELMAAERERVAAEAKLAK